MTRQQPPYRADHVGSFLRTTAIRDARAKRAKGEITADQLETVENAEIAKIVRKQEECGLKLATDGEFRRSWWHFDFLCGLDGVEMKQIDHGIQYDGEQTKA
jgi:5-methyltetrahydropteroyltriglutamate--homocysteine methyltransferase